MRRHGPVMGMTHYASDRIGQCLTMSTNNEIVISKALHILTINCVINLPTVSSGYSEVYCRSGSWSRASRKSGGVEWSGAVRRSYRKTMQQSGARSGHRGVGMEWGAGLNYKKY